MKSGPWDAREDDIALRMRRDDRHLQEIADVLQRTKNSVRHRLSTLRRDGRDIVEYKRGPKPDPLLEKTMASLTANKRQTRAANILSCTKHLVDLLREYGGDTLGFAKERYRAANELLIPPGAERTPVTVRVEASYCGSPAATCAGY